MKNNKKIRTNEKYNSLLNDIINLEKEFQYWANEAINKDSRLTYLICASDVRKVLRKRIKIKNPNI